MPDYRCYFLNADGHIVAVENLYESPNDAEAGRTALMMLTERPHHHSVEVWDKDRRVARHFALGS
jgi:hypothetical protein